MDQIDKIKTKLGSQNNAVQDSVMCEPVNKFIDHVVQSIETSLPKSKFNLNVNLALKQECECRRLQPIELSK